MKFSELFKGKIKLEDDITEESIKQLTGAMDSNEKESTKQENREPEPEAQPEAEKESSKALSQLVSAFAKTVEELTSANRELALLGTGSEKETFESALLGIVGMEEK